MDTLQKTLASTILIIFFLGLSGFLAYTQGAQAVQERMTTAAPLQTTNHIITPTAEMNMVSHTEYWSGETGMIAVRLVDSQGNPISVTNCTASILDPSNNYIIDTALMSSSTFPGNFYYNFTVPATEGVYQYSSTCNWAPNKQQTASSSFHVSPALNLEKVINTSINTNNALLVNLTSQTLNIYNDTQYIRSNMLTEATFNTSITNTNAQFTTLQNNVSQLMQYCSNPQTSTSTLCAYLQNINTTIAGTITNTALLEEINLTTHNTYNYMTTTLFNKVNDVFNLANDINNTITQTQNTVNNINTTTTQTQNTINNVNTTTTNINNDTQAILDQLNNQVTMTVSSG